MADDAPRRRPPPFRADPGADAPLFVPITLLPIGQLLGWDSSQGLALRQLARRPGADFCARVYPVLEDADQTFAARQPEPVQPARRPRPVVVAPDPSPPPPLMDDASQQQTWAPPAVQPTRRPQPFRADPGAERREPFPPATEQGWQAQTAGVVPRPPRGVRYVAQTEPVGPTADDPRTLPDWQAEQFARFRPPRFVAAIADVPAPAWSIDLAPWSGALDARQGLALRTPARRPAPGDDSAGWEWQAAYNAAYVYAEAWSGQTMQPRRREPSVRPGDVVGTLEPSIVLTTPYIHQDAGQPARRRTWFAAATPLSDPWDATSVVVVPGPYYVAAAQMVGIWVQAGDVEPANS